MPWTLIWTLLIIFFLVAPTVTLVLTIRKAIGTAKTLYAALEAIEKQEISCEFPSDDYQTDLGDLRRVLAAREIRRQIAAEREDKRERSVNSTIAYWRNIGLIGSSTKAKQR